MRGKSHIAYTISLSVTETVFLIVFRFNYKNCVYRIFVLLHFMHTPIRKTIFLPFINKMHLKIFLCAAYFLENIHLAFYREHILALFMLQNAVSVYMSYITTLIV